MPTSTSAPNSFAPEGSFFSLSLDSISCAKTSTGDACRRLETHGGTAGDAPAEMYNIVMLYHNFVMIDI
jgi:hypothetical protein